MPSLDKNDCQSCLNCWETLSKNSGIPPMLLRLSFGPKIYTKPYMSIVPINSERLFKLPSQNCAKVHAQHTYNTWDKTNIGNPQSTKFSHHCSSLNFLTLLITNCHADCPLFLSPCVMFFSIVNFRRKVASPPYLRLLCNYMDGYSSGANEESLKLR